MVNAEKFENIKITTEKLKEMLNFENFSQVSEFIEKKENSKYKLKILLLISNSLNPLDHIPSLKESFNYDQRKDFDRIMKIDNSNPKKSSFFFGYYYITENPFYSYFITFANNKDISRYFIRPFVNVHKDLNLLWITHSLAFRFIDYIENKLEGNLYEYRGKYLPSSKKTSKIRPLYSRKNYYKALDCSKYLKEQHEHYGISVEIFSATINTGDFYFNRKLALLAVKSIDFSLLNIIIHWIFKQTEKYLSEIRKFKFELYKSKFIRREYQLSNNLKISFNQKINDEVLSEMKMIIGSDFEILDSNFSDMGGEPIYHYNLLNKDKKTVFNVIITPNFAKIIHQFRSNFLSVLPLLDIFDYYQPNYQIATLG